MDRALRWLELADPQHDYWEPAPGTMPSALLVRHAGAPLGWVRLPCGRIHVEVAGLHQQVAEQLDYPLLQHMGEKWIGGAPQRSGCRDLSVVVVVHRGGSILARCLEALAQQRLTPAEILLVGARPDTPQPAATDVRWLGGAPGPAAARNRGWRTARSEVVVFTDESARPVPDWLECLGAVFDPGTSAVGGPVLAEGVAVPEQAWYEQSRDGSACGLQRFHVAGDSAPHTQRLWGAYLDKRNLAVRRQALSALEGFDESIDRFGDESARDYLHRLLSNGACLTYEPAALVAYLPPAGPRALRRHALETGRGFAAYLRRRRGAMPARRLLRFALNQWWRRRLLARLRRPAGLPRSLVLLEMAGALWPTNEIVLRRRIRSGSAVANIGETSP